MNTNNRYLLLLDPQQEILNLQETALRCFYNGEVYSMTDSAMALEFLAKKNEPEIIIVDADMLPLIDTRNILSPIIATLIPPVQKNFLKQHPLVAAVIEKPLSAKIFSQVVRMMTTDLSVSPPFIPVKFPVLLKLGVGHFDLYLKLSETNFVKILHKGEPFFDSDASRLTAKGIHELYIKFEDSENFLKLLELDITRREVDLDINLTIENLEVFEKIAKYLKWTPAVLVSAEKSVSLAAKILSKKKNVFSVLKEKLSKPNSRYSHHIGLLTYLVCGFSASIGSVGETGQVKLALAALIHDLGVDDKYYENIKEWNKRATDPTDKSIETLKYRMHPYEASKIVKSLDSFTPDVDQIIMQHHEHKDGSGFPRSIDSSRIGLLPAVFIIVEDLVGFIDDGENFETSITDFIMWGQAYYNSGHFKKIFVSFLEGLKED